MSTECLSEFGLEAYLLHPSEAASAHLAGCAACGARLARAQEIGERFTRNVYPRTVDEVVRRASSGRYRWWRTAAFGAVPAVAAASIVALLLVGSPPEIGIKGAGLSLVAYRDGEGGASIVEDGAPVPADAALRMRVRAVTPCRLWVVSVDGAGQISRLFPAAGDDGAPIDKPTALPGGVRLDGVAGPERLFAVCSPQALAFKTLEAAVHEQVAVGAAPVRAVHALTGLPSGTLQGTLLLEKQP